MIAQSLTDHLRATLASVEATGRRRTRRVVFVPDHRHPVRVNVDGRSCIAYCSNDYLGLATHPELAATLTRAAHQYGTGSGASHLVSGHSPAHEALETLLADFCGRERALVFSTGYMANLAIAATLVGRGDLVIEDRLNHASLLDSGLASGARLLRYRHADAGAAARLLERPARRRLVMTDGVFSMDGDRAPLTGLIGACDRHDAWLSVDDAHGFGVLGPGGRGTLELLPDRGQSIPVLMATLGKALGSFGAFVAGSRDLIEVLVQRARTYIYTTALPPAVAAAAQRAVEIAREEPWRRSHVLELAARFQRGARSLGLGVAASETPIQPLLIGDERSTVEASAALLEAGCLVPAIRPPTVPSGSSRLRITFSAAHSTADVDRLLDVLSDWQARPRAVAAQ